MESMEVRVARLETRLSRYRWGALALVLTLVGVGVMTGAQQAGNPPIAECLRAKRVEIVAENGEVLGTLTTDKSGCSIELVGKPGDKRGVYLGSSPLGGVMMLSSTTGTGASFLGAGAIRVSGGITGETISVSPPREGQPKVDENPTELPEVPKPIVLLGSMPNGGGKLTIATKEGNVVLHAGALTKGGVLTIANNDEQGVVLLGQGRGGNGGLVTVLNKTGEAACTLEVDEYGGGEIGAWGRKGKGRTLTPGP